METMIVAKNLDFSFRYVIASSVTVLSSIAMKKKGEEKNEEKIIKFQIFIF